MADDDDNRNDHSPDPQNNSSPASPAASDATTSHARNSATKDRKCPFCHQPFTSSSLGRHLDTFIRERNPKAADGIHNVQDIRKLRSAITRRHARVSSGTPNSKTPKSKTDTASPASAPAQRPLPTGEYASPEMQTQPNQARFQPPAEPAHNTSNSHPDKPQQVPTAGRPHWTATGVINNLPPRNSSTPGSRDLPFPRPDMNNYRSLQYNLLDNEDRRNVYAMEQAFKEVIQTVHDAAERVHQQSLFDFDFFSLTFPAACLRVLPPPPSLFSTTPQPSSQSWPLDLPLQAHLEQMNRVLMERVQQKEQILRQSHSPSESVNDLQLVQRSEYQRYFSHIDQAFRQWSNLPEPQKREMWRLEVMRAFAEETGKRKQVEKQLLQTRQLLEQAQSPHKSPSIQMSQQHLRELLNSDMNLYEWDFEKLISKWRNIFLNRQATASAGNAQHSSPNDFDTGPAPGGTNQLRPGYTPTSAYSDSGSPAINAINGKGHSQMYDDDVQMQDAMSGSMSRPHRIYPKDSAG